MATRMALWAIAAAALLAVVCATPLDDYVNTPDPTYKWQNVTSVFAGVVVSGHSRHSHAVRVRSDPRGHLHCVQHFPDVAGAHCAVLRNRRR
jgi:uncharacterized lipoprotein YajG